MNVGEIGSLGSDGAFCAAAGFTALRAIAPIGFMPRHGNVAASGTKEPPSIGASLHHSLVLALDAKGALNGFGHARRPHSSSAF